MNELFSALGFNEEEIRLTGLFFPAGFQQRARALINKTRFVHYTSASAAASIIQGRSIWLRNATTMNDYREISFGIDQVVKCLGRRRETETARSFWDLIEGLGEGLSQQIASSYDGWLNDLRFNTYLFSLSEHDASEDDIGRLSMWRAYGGETGVAIVINGQSIHTASDALSTYSFPVFYSADDTAEGHFSDLVKELTREKDFLASQSRETLAAWVFSMLQAYSLCSKHPGFREEREWRVVHQPKLNSSPRVRVKKADIKGHPQLIYELPLRDVPDENLLGLELNNLIDRVIIGPTKYPLALFDYCCSALEEAGVVEPDKRVFISHIPLRT